MKPTKEEVLTIVRSSDIGCQIKQVHCINKKLHVDLTYMRVKHVPLSFYCPLFKVSPKDTKDIEKSTRMQAKSKTWFDERKWRITASRFGDIVKMTCKNDLPQRH